MVLLSNLFLKSINNEQNQIFINILNRKCIRYPFFNRMVGNKRKRIQLIKYKLQKQLRIQMIFPKKQMKIVQASGQQIQKQALELIIQLYLSRKKHEDISFLKQNFHTTQEFAKCIRSSLRAGLTSLNAKTNKIIYGQNQKKPSSKCFSFKECCIKELGTFFFISTLIFLVSCIIISAIRNNNYLYKASLTIAILHLFGTIFRLFALYCFSKRLQIASLQKSKNSKYQVIRNGCTQQIQQSEIVVGDIIQLGFHQKVPATGLIISSKEIFVKQNFSRQMPPQHKVDLQSCINKIQSMSNLDLKLKIQKSTLPSPIVLRGSEILKGDSYSILVMSVTQQNLLKTNGINKQDKFSNQNFDQWINKLTKRWRIWGFFIIGICTILLPLTSFTHMKLKKGIQHHEIQILIQTLLKLATIILIFNFAPIRSYFDILYMKLMINIKVIENFPNFFQVRKFICNEQNIVEFDKINITHIALCQKTDIIACKQIQTLNNRTSRLINQVNKVFRLNLLNKIQDDLDKKEQNFKFSRIVCLYTKYHKIISILWNPGDQIQIPQKTQRVKNQRNRLINLQNYRGSGKRHSSFLINKQTPRSYNGLQVPKLFSSFYQQDQNIKEMMHSQCKMVSKNVLDNIVNLVQKNIRTYYFQVFDLKSLDDFQSVILDGKIIQFSSEFKERMAILAKKLKLVYNLTPITIGFKESSYNQKSMKTLLCIFGIQFSQQNLVIDHLKQLSQIGISSLILVNQTNQKDENQNLEKTTLQQYVQRKWIQKQDTDKIMNQYKIKKLLKRLVCRNCLISNCDCKDKIQQTTNIQQFIQLSETLKIIYNSNYQGLKYIQSAYRQLQTPIVCANSLNISAKDLIQSIFICLKFLQTLNRTTILFYCLTITYFTNAFIFWARSSYNFPPLQAASSFLIALIFMFIGFLFQNKASIGKLQDNQQRIRIIKKQTTIINYIICLFITVGSQLFNSLHFFIPEYQDMFDVVISNFQLNPLKCKYHSLDGNRMARSFDPSICSVPQTGYHTGRLCTVITVYVYFCLWMLIVSNHRNFKNVGSIITYIASLLTFLQIIQNFPHVLQTYSYGLTIQHYLIIVLASFITLVIGCLVGLIISRLSIVNYFEEETQSSICLFGDKYGYNKSHGYAKILKGYHIRKKCKQIAKKQ